MINTTNKFSNKVNTKHRHFKRHKKRAEKRQKVFFESYWNSTNGFAYIGRKVSS